VTVLLGGPGRRCVVLMDQSSRDDTLVDVRPSPGPGRGAVSPQSSRDKRRKRSLPGSTVRRERREGRAISAGAGWPGAAPGTGPVRVLALWSPDWPVTAAARAAHVPAERPAAVVVANRVLACSAVARACGVRRGLRRREAQARCPELVVLTRDADRDARLFEPVVAAVEELAPGVEVVRPGLVALPVQGPSGYFARERAVRANQSHSARARERAERANQCHSARAKRRPSAARECDERACERTVHHSECALCRIPLGRPSAARECAELAAAERLVDQVAARAGVECQAGVADGLFAAVLAARRGVAVEAGCAAAFLAPLGVEELDREPEVDRSELVGLLRRLGLRSLGAFGALAPADVASRFGADAVLAHRLARGLDPRPPVRRCPPAELAVERELDPPVDRIDAAAFAARVLAEQLHTVLAAHGLSCTRLGVEARTVAGEELHRVWRCAEPLTPAGTVDRVRWQLDSWLVRGGSGAVCRLRLVPEETVTAGALQLGLWGDVGEADERAGRALVRVQALLGPEAVVTAVLGGGRDPAERVRLVPWGDDRGDSSRPDPVAPEPQGHPPFREPPPPWPGRLPAPSPTVLLPDPLPTQLCDAAGRPVHLAAPDLLTAPPHSLVIDGGPPGDVQGWAGPWPGWQRWWAPDSVAGSRLQVVRADGAAFLLVARDGRWWVTGVYD
jgi:protein ImuB